MGRPMTSATHVPIQITRHEVPDAAVCDLGRDKFRLDDVVTIECGDVTGVIVRHLDDETEDGTREVVYEARLNGSHETGGFSNWCSYTAAHLAELMAVTQALEAEWMGLQ